MKWEYGATPFYCTICYYSGVIGLSYEQTKGCLEQLGHALLKYADAIENARESGAPIPFHRDRNYRQAVRVAFRPFQPMFVLPERFQSVTEEDWDSKIAREGLWAWFPTFEESDE